MATKSQFLVWHNFYVTPRTKTFELFNQWLDYCEGSKMNPYIRDDGTADVLPAPSAKKADKKAVKKHGERFV